MSATPVSSPGYADEILAQEPSFFSKFCLDGLLALADCVVLLGLLALISQLRRTKSLLGLSLQTIVALTVTRVLHFASCVLGFHFDATRFLLLDLAIVVALVFVCLQVFEFFPTYQGLAVDKFGRFLHPNDHAQCACLYVAALTIALLTMSIRRTEASFSSFVFCFHEILTLLALLPQLYMFAATAPESRSVDLLLKMDFLLFFGLSKVLNLGFWILFPVLISGVKISSSADTISGIEASAAAGTAALAASGVEVSPSDPAAVASTASPGLTGAAAAADQQASSATAAPIVSPPAAASRGYPANRGVQMFAEFVNLLLLSDFLYGRLRVRESVRTFLIRNFGFLLHFLAGEKRSRSSESSADMDYMTGEGDVDMWNMQNGNYGNNKADGSAMQTVGTSAGGGGKGGSYLFNYDKNSMMDHDMI
ncbi:unnamed protein product [Amoebophrya sp. A120]|nr:unnamed protein product [Amoebophrya sp. A120]|eukprot:GSA120T00012138001.1